MGIVNNTIEDIKLRTDIVLGHLFEVLVLHLGREDAYALDPSEQPPSVWQITSQVRSDLESEEVSGVHTEEVSTALFLEEKGMTSKQEG